MYDNPGGMIAGAVILEVLAVICVGLRFYSRRIKKIYARTTDWLILAALICGTGLTALEIYGVASKALAYPLGGTFKDPKAIGGRLLATRKVQYAGLVIGVLGLGLIKISMGLLYWSLFAEVKLRRFLVLWNSFLVFWTVGFIVAALLECGSHFNKLFGTPKEFLQFCGHGINIGWAYVGTDVATDLITLIIPIPIVIQLRLSLGRKMLVLATFMIGSLSVGASVAKAYIYISTSLGRLKGDAVLLPTGITIWNLAEVQIGIIAACCPSLQHIIRHTFPNIRTKSRYQSNGGTVEANELPTFSKIHSTEDLQPCR